MGQLIGQCHLLTLVVVLDQVAQRVNGFEQGQHRFASCTYAVGWMFHYCIQPGFVGSREHRDALVLELIHPRTPPRVAGQVRQQLVFLDGDMVCQLLAPALQAPLRTTEVAPCNVQQVRMQLRIEAAVFAFKVRWHRDRWRHVVPALPQVRIRRSAPQGALPVGWLDCAHLTGVTVPCITPACPGYEQKNT